MASCLMPFVPSIDDHVLIQPAMRALGLTQGGLGDLLGVSKRTISRLFSGQSHLGVDHFATLARAVHAHDEYLAAKLASAAGSSLEGLGLAPPPSPPPPEPPVRSPPVRPFPPIVLMLDSILYAAKEASARTSGDVKEVLRAAFERTEGLGVSVEEVNSVLNPPAAREVAAVARLPERTPARPDQPPKRSSGRRPTARRDP